LGLTGGLIAERLVLWLILAAWACPSSHAA
jgi:hypothetical protein